MINKTIYFFFKKVYTIANTRCHQVFEKYLSRNTGKNRIIAKLEKDLVNYETQKLTAGHQKEATDLMEQDIGFFKTQFAK